MRALSWIRGKKSVWIWTCSTSAAASSLFHVPNGFAYYVAQDIRHVSREQERETVYSPVCPRRQLCRARRKVQCLIKRR